MSEINFTSGRQASGKMSSLPTLADPLRISTIRLPPTHSTTQAPLWPQSSFLDSVESVDLLSPHKAPRSGLEKPSETGVCMCVCLRFAI